MIVLGLILLAVSAAAGFCLWTRPAAGWLARAPWWLVVLVPAAPLAVAAAVAAAAGAVDDTVSPLLAYPLAVVAAVAGGNPSSRTILAAARRTDSAPPAGYAVPQSGYAAPAAGYAGPASVLRGGAWIGALERIAICAAVFAGSAEGVAVILAVKTFGRYPELRTRNDSGAAEQFIIGTLVSALWAVGSAGTAILLVG